MYVLKKKKKLNIIRYMLMFTTNKTSTIYKSFDLGLNDSDDMLLITLYYIYLSIKKLSQPRIWEKANQTDRTLSKGKYTT